MPAPASQTPTQPCCSCSMLAPSTSPTLPAIPSLNPHPLQGVCH
jgi:hypothetical protein